MGLKASQYQAIMRDYEQRQLRNHDRLTRHYGEVYKKLPEFKSIDESISILSVQYGRKLLNGDDKAIDSLKEELAILRSSKKNFCIREDSLRIIWNLFMTVKTAWIPATSAIRSATA